MSLISYDKQISTKLTVNTDFPLGLFNPPKVIGR